MNHGFNREEIRILLVGIGGYGNTYVSALLEEGAKHGCAVAGVVDPFADRAAGFKALSKMGVNFHDSLESFFSSGEADLAVISSPIHCHHPQTMDCLKNVSGVLCEKPLAATIQDAREISEAAEEKAVAVGYQWSYSEAMQNLKRDILRGLYGKPLRMKTLVLWPRASSYYKRNDWAGRITTSDGRWVLDSPVNNATAHYLHNMFFCLGDKPNTSTRPAAVTTELYRANDIENYDTCALMCLADGGVPILFLTSHAVEIQEGPLIEYVFENGYVSYGDGDERLTGRISDGKEVDYGNPNKGVRNKLWNIVNAVRRREEILCPPAAALSQTLCMNGAQESPTGIIDFEKPKIKKVQRDGGCFTAVSGLEDDFRRCYDEFKMPSELKLPWAVKGRSIDLKQYNYFPSKAHSGNRAL
jgi:predicted dehydrogenase